MRLLLLLGVIAACGSDDITVMARDDIEVALPRGTRADEPATQRLIAAIEHGGKQRAVYRCVRSALVLTIPTREPVAAARRRQPDGSFFELIVLPTIDRVDGAQLDPIELDLVLAYPDDLVVFALAGRC